MLCYTILYYYCYYWKQAKTLCALWIYFFCFSGNKSAKQLPPPFWNDILYAEKHLHSATIIMLQARNVSILVTNHSQLFYCQIYLSNSYNIHKPVQVSELHRWKVTRHDLGEELTLDLQTYVCYCWKEEKGLSYPCSETMAKGVGQSTGRSRVLLSKQVGF